MADMDKVIKGFECCHVMVHDLGPDKTSCGMCPYKDVQTEEQIDLGGIECIAALHDDALAMLKEQEPVEPKTEPSAKGYWFTCGACGWWLFEVRDTVHFDDRKRIRYCASCGRKVKWDHG